MAPRARLLDTPTLAPDPPWASRIVGDDDRSPFGLLANPLNFRVHASYQKQAMDAVLRSVGIIQRVIVNTTTGHVIDGHMRIELALEIDQPTVPVTYVTLTEAEERAAIRYYHQVGSYAGVDRGVLRDLLSSADELDTHPTITKMLDDMRLVAKKDLMLPPDGFDNADPSLFGADAGKPRAKQDTYQAPEPDNNTLMSGRGTVALDTREAAPERFALSIVLTQADMRRWQAVKDALAIKADTAAFLAVLQTLEGVRDGG